MKKYLVLILSGAAGYIAYPALAPALLGTKKEQASGTVTEKIKKPKPKAEVIAKAKPKADKSTMFGIAAKMQNEAKIPVLPKKAEPDTGLDSPTVIEEEKLTSADFEKIITQEVETGKIIQFRENNIIEWKLLDQQFEEIDGKYEGVVKVQTVNLFGKAPRTAQVTIVGKKIRNWHWLEQEQ